jgi:hypothetical protein
LALEDEEKCDLTTRVAITRICRAEPKSSPARKGSAASFVVRKTR